MRRARRNTDDDTVVTHAPACFLKAENIAFKYGELTINHLVFDLGDRPVPQTRMGVQNHYIQPPKSLVSLTEKRTQGQRIDNVRLYRYRFATGLPDLTHDLIGRDPVRDIVDDYIGPFAAIKYGYCSPDSAGRASD